MPMKEEDRHELLMAMDREELVKMAEDGIDKVWDLVERLFYIGKAVGMPNELLQEAMMMDDEMFARVEPYFHGRWEKNQEDDSEDGPTIIVLDLRMPKRNGAATDGIRIPTSDDSRD